MDSFQSIYEKSLSEGYNFQVWPGQFLMRKIETEIISNLFEFGSKKIGLEIGCGIGFQSSLIASRSKRIIATDLFSPNKSSHTIGMNRAKEFLSLMDSDNIYLVSCSAEALPFKNNYFDYVFSSSVLEHLEDKDKALTEIKRVLKKEGYIVAVIPNFMLSIYAFFHLPLYIIKRTFQILFQKDNLSITITKYDSKKAIQHFRENHPSFPFPEPHGNYKSILHEFFGYFPSRWEYLFKKNGFKIISSYTTCILPWSILEIFSTQLGAKIYQFTQKIHTAIKLPKYFSYLFSIIAQKIN